MNRVITTEDSIMRLKYAGPFLCLMLLSLPCLGLAQSCDQCANVDRGVVFVIGGVGGWDILGRASQWELPRVGIYHEIRDFAWTHGFGQPFKDLKDTPHMLRKADELADEVLKVKHAN